MKKVFLALFAGLFLFISSTSTFAQTRTDANLHDVFVILDVSGSMKEQNRFANVQDYLENEVVNNLLVSGDDFTLVTFGEKVTERFTRTIVSEADKTALKSDLRRLAPNEDFTDIGSAMEKLAEILEKKEKPDAKRVILFITDGLNAPPPGSKFYGADISLDSRFKSLGERISRGSWFFYVIGIGGQTSAQDIANLVPGSEVKTTGSDLGGMDFAQRVSQQEQEELARAEAQRLEEARRLEEAKMLEERRLEEERLLNEAGFMGGMRRFAASTGIPLPLLFVLVALLILLLILLVLLLKKASKVQELLISDEKETLTMKIKTMETVTINSPGAILPSIGKEAGKQVFSVSRGLFGYKVQILDSGVIDDKSPYKKAGTYPLKGGINLANGSKIRVRVR